MLASVNPPTMTLSSLRKIRKAYARSPRWSSAYRLSLRRKAPRVRSSGGHVGSQGTRNSRLVSRKAAHSAKSPLWGARNEMPAPAMLGIVSLELTVLKNAMDYVGRAPAAQAARRTGLSAIAAVLARPLPGPRAAIAGLARLIKAP